MGTETRSNGYARPTPKGMIELEWEYYQRFERIYRRTRGGHAERWDEDTWILSDDSYLREFLHEGDVFLDRITLADAVRLGVLGQESITVELTPYVRGMIQLQDMIDAAWRDVRANPPNLDGLNEGLKARFPEGEQKA